MLNKNNLDLNAFASIEVGHVHITRNDEGEYAEFVGGHKFPVKSNNVHAMWGMYGVKPNGESVHIADCRNVDLMLAVIKHVLEGTKHTEINYITDANKMLFDAVKEANEFDITKIATTKMSPRAAYLLDDVQLGLRTYEEHPHGSCIQANMEFADTYKYLTGVDFADRTAPDMLGIIVSSDDAVDVHVQEDTLETLIFLLKEIDACDDIKQTRYLTNGATFEQHILVSLASSVADILINKTGTGFDMTRVANLELAGYKVAPGETDSSGMLSAYAITSKGRIVFG